MGGWMEERGGRVRWRRKGGGREGEDAFVADESEVLKGEVRMEDRNLCLGLEEMVINVQRIEAATPAPRFARAETVNRSTSGNGCYRIANLIILYSSCASMRFDALRTGSHCPGTQDLLFANGEADVVRCATVGCTDMLYLVPSQ